MNRPLIKRRIDELEAMFKAEQGDPAALHLLEAELSLRSMPRAVTLLGKVKRAVDGDALGLFPEHVPAEGTVIQLPTDPPRTSVSSAVMSQDEAFKLLRANQTTPWEEIELTRRKLVERSRPDKLAVLSDKQRIAIQEEGRRANAAYVLLLQGRRT